MPISIDEFNDYMQNQYGIYPFEPYEDNEIYDDDDDDDDDDDE